jgi:hypothetical protein
MTDGIPTTSVLIVAFVLAVCTECTKLPSLAQTDFPNHQAQVACPGSAFAIAGLVFLVILRLDVAKRAMTQAIL